MATFTTVLSVVVEADNAIHASGNAERILAVGREHRYFTGGAVVSIEPVAQPIYTQAQLDAAVAAAVEAARSNA